MEEIVRVLGRAVTTRSHLVLLSSKKKEKKRKEKDKTTGAQYFLSEIPRRRPTRSQNSLRAWTLTTTNFSVDISFNDIACNQAIIHCIPFQHLGGLVLHYRDKTRGSFPGWLLLVPVVLGYIPGADLSYSLSKRSRLEGLPPLDN